MFTIVSESKFDLKFNPNEYMFYLKIYLLEKSENMIDYVYTAIGYKTYTVVMMTKME